VNEIEFPAISVTVFVSRFEKVGKTISDINIINYNIIIETYV